VIDFSSLRKPDQKNRPPDPREIFKRRPSGEGAANDLWQGQAEALSKWFEGKKANSLILLNTGAGKTIVGLLIAQSYVNQNVPNVKVGELEEWSCSGILKRLTDRKLK
jgi:replicative superfamily II helicase